ncbi:MAG: anthranilate phosphoribosyltransferase [Bacteroidetes bacterium]|nr:anthranilate phosphoribosyltransferase [Bacteroidota bacterium]
MKEYIEKCLEGHSLTVDEAASALELIMTEQASEAQIAGLLVALRGKGETVDELVGFARTMREKSVKVKLDDPDAIDMCGTGGDGLGTFNISTVSALVAAGAGVTVAKHGNRSVSSKSGSADLLRALGVNVSLPPERVGECIQRAGIGFLFAPLFHPAMKHAAKPRQELGIRTIFNMVGPITNPAGVRRQLLGTYNHAVSRTLAGALQKLNSDRAAVVHSNDGMDEITISGETKVYEVSGGKDLVSYSVYPDHFGIKEQPLSAVEGGTPEENAEIAMKILNGERSASRDVVVANAAFGIYVSGKVSELKEASHAAAESIDSGNALRVLNKLIEYTGKL